MYCRICGEKIPEDSRFCPHCGREIVPSPVSCEEHSCSASSENRKCFSFPETTTYDRAAEAINTWLTGGNRTIQSADFTLGSTLLAGTLVPTVTEVTVHWTDAPGGKPYRLGMMMDSCTDFGLGKKKKSKHLTRQYDRWKAEHPDYEVAGLQQISLSLGWMTAWISCFFFR